MKRQIIAGIVAIIGFTQTAQAAPTLMSAEWAKSACEAWNQDEQLTSGLSGWMKNHKNRGYKVMQIYREDCDGSPRIELTIQSKEGVANCVYGGVVQHEALDSDADYVMYASTEKWVEMGAGEYGPAKAMMLGRLGFQGPKLEAMSNMGPFENFLKLVGKVDSDANSCPAQ
jgi:putative sterol carrier protein